ncbi:hypothetical protein C6A77_15715 [Pseudomonas sp. AFG_SD02_1510_Pfu_092]|uniref:hypothetical protein n=1 Tax=Pseudomonas sp. AFG_SD02_1510_Pfu_092 TaxID=2259497 RepID=UPI000DEF1A9A|nr:hypothetical protein [Pseudomonas sp. AFG_SD02_1510_Pfu_092]RCL24724.1 hypothetical protein C6A77_15715 [Pseudomonas sp. AFG_SD02_1510_Pfu_092]
MNDAQAAMLLFRRQEGAARQALLLHELEARVSADGRSLVLSRYRERVTAEGTHYRHEVHRNIPLAALLRWVARHGQ